MSTAHTPYFADGYRRLGVLRKKREEYQKAITLFRKELIIRSQHRKQQPIDYFSCKLRLAEVYDASSDYHNVLQVIEGDANHYKSLFGANSNEAETALSLLGSANEYLGNYEEAKTYFRDVVRIAENNNTETSLRMSWIYQDLGGALSRLFEYEEAVIWLKRAIRTRYLHQPVVDPTVDFCVAYSHRELANIYLAKNQFGQAHENVNKAIDVFTKKKGDPYWIFQSVITKSLIHEKQNDVSNARDTLLEYWQQDYETDVDVTEYKKELSERLVEVLERLIDNNQKRSIEERKSLLNDVKLLAIFVGGAQNGIKILLEHKKYFPMSEDYDEFGLYLDHDHNIAKFCCLSGRSDLAWKFLEKENDRLYDRFGSKHPATRIFNRMTNALKKEHMPKNTS